MDNKTHLPIFGVGPIYVLTCFILMVFALILDYKGLLKSGNIIVGKIFIIILGIILIVVGVILWIQSVIIQKISEKIKKDCLVTDGVLLEIQYILHLHSYSQVYYLQEVIYFYFLSLLYFIYI